MKTLILILCFASSSLMAQEVTFSFANIRPKFPSFLHIDSLKVNPTLNLPFASASITITITDNGTYTLADIRDTLCIAWGYSGAQNDNVAKLAFLKQFLINKIANDYAITKQQNLSSTISTQLNIN